MNQILKIQIGIVILLSLIVSVNTGCNEKRPQELPNILWLVSEDNSPFLGCYGDEFATTPNLDKLASEGFRYTHAFANAPVCAPARNTILTGIYANSGGNQHMRSKYPKSDSVKTYPEYLREIGYYCTNNSKTDYNTNSVDPKIIWNESSNKAHYKNRKEGQPFFAVFNTNISHESCIHKSIPNEALRHSPDEVPIPPHHPDTPDMRHDWAQYYDKVEDMDRQIGKWLKELDDAGLSENTIVFYYGDHGGVIARSKRYVYETGTRVPFIVRIPEKYKHLFPAEQPGNKIGRIISFVDLVPTLLSIVGIEVPDYLQGNAFLGDQKTEDPEYAFMFRGRMDERYDMCRAVRDHKFRYIRNYMPYRIYGQRLEYLFRAPSIRSWKKAYEDGECNATQSAFWNTKPVEELYDTENDPWEVNNLANDPAYQDVMKRMRKENHDWAIRIHDTGFIPEADLVDRAGENAMYDYMRSGQVQLEGIVEAANLATLNDPGNIKTLISYLSNEESAIRYWGATGLLILGDKAVDAKDALKGCLNDPSPNVAAMAAEALYMLGEKAPARQALIKVLKSPNLYARCHALNVLDCIEDEHQDSKKAVIDVIAASDPENKREYDVRAATWLIEKWKIDPDEHGIGFAW